ncbi:HipA domain-containing protein [Pseudomonas sp. S1(2024)]|uniref:HipA domain-containing protein n=1 Tax=Pseudomonas sp. S1(2024) TaxID=3390191 RepID=UPI00397CC82A
MRELQVVINSDHVATLKDQSGIWSLEYTPAWIEHPNGYDLAPTLPRSAGVILDGSTKRPVQWFFDNLLPEEQARTLLAGDAKIEFADAFGLLGYYGAESAGAITLLNTLDAQEQGGLRPLPDNELSERIQNLPRVALTTGAPKRMSLAGAQHKLAVVMNDEGLFEPEGATPSTHILKPDHDQPNQYNATVVNEWFIMSLAKRVWGQVPPVSIRRVPEPVYLIERFDRARVNGQLVREHVLDACQLLGLDRNFKYNQATLESLQKILGMVRNVAQTRMQLFTWLVFNTLVGNGDNHLKNLSFFVRGDSYHMTPHYDMLCTAVYGEDMAPWINAELVWKLDGARTFGEVTFGSFLKLGKEIGLGEKIAGSLITKVSGKLLESAHFLMENHQEGMTAGEKYLVRRIIYGVITDMVKRLKP